MGCASSTFLNQEQEFGHISGSKVFSDHIVSLTSTTYGFLSLDPPPSLCIDDHSPNAVITPSAATPPLRKRITLGSLFPSSLSEAHSIRYQPMESINTWDLMSGLDSDRIPSVRFAISPSIHSKTPDSQVGKHALGQDGDEENICPNSKTTQSLPKVSIFEKLAEESDLFTAFEKICPPNGKDKVVVYTTTLRGVRRTFEDCNAVRAAIEGLGIALCERDVSMDRGFRDELRELMKAKGCKESIPPRVFVKGRYIGGAEEVLRLMEEGCLGDLLQGLPKMRSGYVCEGCGGVRFLPCSACNGSCKVTLLVNEDGAKQGKTITVRCSKCNENGLIVCPVCS